MGSSPVHVSVLPGGLLGFLERVAKSLTMHRLANNFPNREKVRELFEPAMKEGLKYLVSAVGTPVIDDADRELTLPATWTDRAHFL